MEFRLSTSLRPKGDQPKAIESLVRGLKEGIRNQVLLGVTGSGKTFTMANVIEEVQKPALVIAPNKTLAAQLYSEFKEFFPENAVEYFVSYYDYYQPEAYIPQTDTYIAKDADVNREIEKLRHSATRSLLDRRDVIVVASVSCIYGLGDPKDYLEMSLLLEAGSHATRRQIMDSLVSMQYSRNDMAFEEGEFRVRGDVIDVHPPYGSEYIRVELGEGIEKISLIDFVTGKKVRELDKIRVYPAGHYMLPPARKEYALTSIKKELGERLAELESQAKLLEAQRLKQRTEYDLEMIREIGYCSGIENYSMYLSGRSWGDPPHTLLDFYPDDFLTFIDESHITVPQIGGMYEGDYSRKKTLVEHGFRLPSAVENRPLKINEFWGKVGQVIYVSATPSEYERRKSAHVVEQIIRPTGLVDPQVEVRETADQIDDLISEIKKRVAREERILVTTLTKRMAEDLAEYLNEEGLKVRYLHSEIKTLERVEILRDLRLGRFDVLVGINLLREGLDLPEVSLVAILDADKEGFLRSETSLIQTIGRCSRNVYGKVILYADNKTKSMDNAISETERRRNIQVDYNRRNNITPETVRKQIRDLIVAEETVLKKSLVDEKLDSLVLDDLRREMRRAAGNLDFERAAKIRDLIASREKEK